MPVRTPRIHFETVRGIQIVWHRVFNSGIVEVKGSIALCVLQHGIDVTSLEKKDTVEQSDEGPQPNDKLSYVRGRKVPMIQCTVQRGPVALHILHVGAGPGVGKKHTRIFSCRWVHGRTREVKYSATQPISRIEFGRRSDGKLSPKCSLVAVVEVGMKGGHATAKGEAQPVRKEPNSFGAGPL